MDAEALSGDESVSAMQNQQNFGHSHGRGPSSFWMHDPDVIFGEIGLKGGESFLDMGCGPGDYAIYAAKIVGDEGAIYAIDRWDDMIRSLLQEAGSQGLKNIIGIVSDITTTLPLKDNCVDVCFISTVLHTLDINKAMIPLLDEVRRVLKPTGRLAIIECKKQAAPFGPPIHMCLSLEEVEEIVTPYSFVKIGFTDLGYNYLIQFEVDP